MNIRNNSKTGNLQRSLMLGATLSALLPVAVEAATLSLFSGSEPTISTNGSALMPHNGLQLPANAAITTPEGSRARVVLDSGDLIFMAEKSQLTLTSDSATVILNAGTVVGYALPTLRGREKGLIVETPEGEVESRTGKFALRQLEQGGTELSVFDNRARWSGADGRQSRHQLAGTVTTLLQGESTTVPATLPQEITLDRATSPEDAVATSAVKLYAEKSKQQAAERFRQLQSAYPYNAKAAYYLGQMALEEQDLSTAIKQWRKYEKIDPQGARERDVPKQLTLLIAEKVKEDVEVAMANEAKLSSQPPEPNSVAVPPLNNKGSDKFESISKGLAAMMISDLSKVPGLKVLERTKIQKLMDEIKLSQTALVDKNSAVRGGRIIKAEKMVIGDYTVNEQEGK